MRLLIGIVAALFAAVGIALLLRTDSGYVLITVGQWTIETSVAVSIVLGVVAFALLYLIFQLLGRLWRMPRKLRVATRRYRVHKGQRLLAQGMKELVEGRWAAAEATFTKSVEYSETPALHYIGAAQAAQRLKAPMRRDNYLRQADNLPNQNALAVGLSKAEILLASEQPVGARDILVQLQREHPRNSRVLELLAQSYRKLDAWMDLKEILPQLQKYRALSDPQYTELQVQTYRELLNNKARSGTPEDLRTLWNEIPKPLQSEELLLIDYVGHLRDHNAADEAEMLLRGALNERWSEKLIVGYGEIGRGNAAAQLEVAEGWLQQRAQDPYLLLTLGRLAARGHQLEKARAYLEQSIKLLPNPDAYQELGDVLEQLDEKEAANQCYRTGLRLLSGKLQEKEGAELIPATGSQEKLPAGEKPPIEENTVAKDTPSTETQPTPKEAILPREQQKTPT